MPAFGKQLKQLRTQLGLTQFEVAHRTGVSNTYISALESGRKPAPPRAIVTALASCLRVPEAELWAVARAEREERLRQRIDGTPTSNRISLPHKADPPEDDPDVALERAIQQLRASASTPAQRRSLADALDALVKRLRS